MSIIKGTVFCWETNFKLSEMIVGVLCGLGYNRSATDRLGWREFEPFIDAACGIVYFYQVQRMRDLYVVHRSRIDRRQQDGQRYSSY